MNAQGTVKQKRPISRSAVVRIVIWSVVLVILCGAFAVCMLAASLGGIWASFGSFSIGSISYRDEDTYQIGGGTVTDAVSNIDIEWISGDIQILPAEEGATAITVSEDYNGDKDDCLRWRVHRGTLQIKFRKSSWWIGTNRVPSKTLTVYIPRDLMSTLGDVRIDTTESGMTFEGSAKSLDVEAVNGKLTVNGEVGHLDIDSVDAEIDFTGSLGDGDFDGVDVSAVLRLDAVRALDIDGVDNDITLYLAETVTGFCVERDSVGGDVRVNGFDGVSMRGEYSYYWGDGSLEIDMDGVDCKLTIEKLTKD